MNNITHAELMKALKIVAEYNQSLPEVHASPELARRLNKELGYGLVIESHAAPNNGTVYVIPKPEVPFGLYGNSPEL